MSKLALKLREELPTDSFTDFEVSRILAGTPHRRHGLVKRALSAGDLIQIRRGVYTLGKRFQRQPINLFELAQRVYPISYVSLESALAYHGWIPEATYTVTSACLKRSALFETPVGLFSYTAMPRFNFVGVERIQEGSSVFLIASPTKALVDYILAHKVDSKDLSSFFKSLRIDRENLRQVSYPTLLALEDFSRSRRISAFIKAFRRISES
jgi:hypothetical protein